jgi:hypothetical protein
MMPRPPRRFDFVAFAVKLYRERLPLHLRLDLQQWFTMVRSKERGAWGCRDARWLQIRTTGTDTIDDLTGAVGVAICLMTRGQGDGSMLQDMLVDEYLNTTWKSTPSGLHNAMAYSAVDDERLAYVCLYTEEGEHCGKLVHLGSPSPWKKGCVFDMSVHPHPSNHYAWREGKRLQTSCSMYGSAFPFRGLRPEEHFYQCSGQGNMPAYHHPSGQWGVSRHQCKKSRERCPGRLCDLERTTNSWTWKTFVRFLMCDAQTSPPIAGFYRDVVLGSVGRIQARWRGYFARAYIRPFAEQTQALLLELSSPPTCVWTSAKTKEFEVHSLWREYLERRRFSTI